MREVPGGASPLDRVAVAYETVARIADDDVASCKAIGEHGARLFADLARDKEKQKGAAESLNILTHCNAGWLATVDYGTALAPVYTAFDAGLDLHVWVDETRPRNQGASLTAWELGQHGVPHTVIADNAGGLLEERAGARGQNPEEYLRTGNLLRREVLAEDVAQAFVALALARKTTAATLTVDGGNIEASLR